MTVTCSGTPSNEVPEGLRQVPPQAEGLIYKRRRLGRVSEARVSEARVSEARVSEARVSEAIH